MIAHTFYFLLVLLSQSASVPTQNLKVTSGDNVTLECDTHDDAITAVEWSRKDLRPPEYVLLYRDGHSDQTYQDSSFKGRVWLADGELKQGDVSLVLKSVTIHDNGTYECRVAGGGSGRRKRAILDGEPIVSYTLQVIPSGPMEREYTGLAIGAGAFALICLAIVTVRLFLARRKKPLAKNSDLSTADKAAGELFI